MTTSGGPRNSSPGTLNRLFFEAVQKFDKPDALQVKSGGSYVPIAHRTLAEKMHVPGKLQIICVAFELNLVSRLTQISARDEKPHGWQKGGHSDCRLQKILEAFAGC